LKFHQAEAIAAREVLGVKGHYDVRMYELAQSIANDIGKEAVKIEQSTKEEPEWQGEYVIRSSLASKSPEGNDVGRKKVLILDDVIMTGNTLESLKRAVSHAHGDVVQSIVIMDRSQQLNSGVYALTSMKRFMELKEMRENGKN
jgi:adenine/guanine phosphoribosyltransferase-like PRPP-binding protein